MQRQIKMSKEKEDSFLYLSSLLKLIEKAKTDLMCKNEVSVECIKSNNKKMTLKIEVNPELDSNFIFTIENQYTEKVEINEVSDLLSPYNITNSLDRFYDWNDKTSDRSVATLLDRKSFYYWLEELISKTETNINRVAFDETFSYFVSMLTQTGLVELFSSKTSFFFKEDHILSCYKNEKEEVERERNK